MKRMLIIGVALVIALGTWAIAFADTYDYNTSGTVYMTLEIPVILVLDMGDPDTTVTWFEATAADLDAGFVVRRGATKIGIRSNDPDGWELSLSTIGDNNGKFISVGSGELLLTALYVESGCIQSAPCASCSEVTVIGFSHNVGCVQTCPYSHDGEWAAFQLQSGSATAYEPAQHNTSKPGLVAEVTDCQGSGWVIMVDYKIAIDWCTVADTYCTCLTYTLAGK